MSMTSKAHKTINDRGDDIGGNHLRHQMHAALHQASYIQSNFSPKKKLESKSLLALARYKINSLGLNPDIWDNGLFVIIPPWDPMLEQAILHNIESRLSRHNALPMLVAVPYYVIMPDDSKSGFEIDNFTLRSEITIYIDGKRTTRRSYAATRVLPDAYQSTG